MATAAIGTTKKRAVWLAIPYIVVLGVIAFGAWQIESAIARYQHGIYAGFHYGDARRTAIDAMIASYGYDFVNKSTFANPPVINTHQAGLLNAGQVRVFHIYGPHGRHYCVSVWGPGSNWTSTTGGGSGINIGGSYNIVKNCAFKKG